MPVRALAPQASASAYSATRTMLIACKRPVNYTCTPEVHTPPHGGLGCIERGVKRDSNYSWIVAQQKILLYYRFIPLADPYAVRLWQQTLCESLNLRGRILVSPHGINGTVGGEIKDLKRYIKNTKQYPGMKDVDFKWSDGSREDFPRLTVKDRAEIVAFGATDELVVDADGVVGGGKHLTPHEVHELIAQRGDDVVFFDGRNAFEATIGRFHNAIVPDVETTHEFIQELESGKYDHLKSKPIVTYCTGGVRCEILSSVMINRGFEEVYQIEGGIVRYGEAFGNQGLWEGSLHVFDKRMVIDFEENPVEIGRCELCHGATKFSQNCPNQECRKFMVLCLSCQDKYQPSDCSHATPRYG